MTWQLYQAIYELHSPLHIGYHKIGNLQRTRYYIPARNLWAAVTERLTRSGFAEQVLQQVLQKSADDYTAVGEWVKEHCAFGYWFVRENNAFLHPQYTSDGLHYGTLSTSDFERRYLSSHVTTALDPATTSAESGTLHEVEFIAPHTPEGARTEIGGWVCLDERAREVLGDESRWRAWLGELHVGGERRYGFGHLPLKEFEPTHNSDWQLDGSRPCILIPKDRPLGAHALARAVEAQGQIEPLMGRETQGKDSRGFGRTLTRAGICWAPGSLVQRDTWFTVEPQGIWIVEA